ncbi:hypothetical protein [Bacillus sp. FJAT-29937]|uniref:hypothetical protein n=1 Tax=Bacillus sp. FJAT-29937 TaxID=1720553 RepID=UPI000831EDD4|nr:hypothetical protein [Bacillus sp. FJAT-29937]
MKKIFLTAAILLLLAACSSATETVEQEVNEAVPTEEERDTFLGTNEFIEEYEHIVSNENGGLVYLTIKMNGDFNQKKISDQYLYLVDFYEDYNEKFRGLLPSFLNSLNVYLNDTEFPTYRVNLKNFSLVAMNIDIAREIGQRPSDKLLQILDNLDITQVMSGTQSGLTLAEVESRVEPPIKGTIITSSEEVQGALSSGYASNSGSSSSLNSNKDSETYIDGMTGYGWRNLTDNQKFHAVSNALYSLDQNGYIILESEYFYIDALNEFYTTSTTMDTFVNEALVSIGIMSKTITK